MAHNPRADPSHLHWQDWAGPNLMTKGFSAQHFVRYKRTLYQNPPQNPHPQYFTSAYSASTRGPLPELANYPPQTIQSYVNASQIPYLDTGYWEGYYLKQGRRRVDPRFEVNRLSSSRPGTAPVRNYGWDARNHPAIRPPQQQRPKHYSRPEQKIAERYRGPMVVPSPIISFADTTPSGSWGAPPRCAQPVPVGFVEIHGMKSSSH
mmetsp:Transcript_28866/g.56675  ORF Transcript_28866/g.56675 Transcript_28866/m.56675 type:complete len:206 (+) Transcript_28866:21-638(+)